MDLFEESSRYEIARCLLYLVSPVELSYTILFTWT
jgi:hypothetical protein